MDLLKRIGKRSFLSETVYIILNVLLALSLLAVVLIVNVPWPAVGLVLLSKWRIFAVRSRYWIANIRANTVDIIVGLSVVVFLFAANGVLPIQILLTVLYVVWLLYLKPRSKRSYIAAQAFTGIILGIGAIAQISPSLPASVVVLLAWIVGYSSARHVLSVQHETHMNFLSLLWGFVVAEIMWLTYHWTIGYSLYGSVQIAQIMVIIAALAFTAERVYMSYHRNGQIVMGDVLLPSVMSLSIVGVLLFVFGGGTTI